MAGATIGEYSGPDHRSGSGFESYRLVDSPLTIRFSTDVLRNIRTAAVAGLLSIRRGGLEIGGVLFGTVEADAVTVLHHRALSIEYVNGPSFTLSGNDETSLELLIEASASDPQLEGMQPVGWYHSHTRSDLTLSSDDIGVHERHFPRPEQIAFLIKPFKFEPAQVALFAGGPDISTRVAAPSCHFEIVSERRPSAEVDDGGAAADAVLDVTVAAPVMEMVPSAPARDSVIVSEPDAPKRRLVSRKAVAIAAGVMLCAAAGVILGKRTPPPVEQITAPMHLHVSAAGDELNVAWDGDSRTVQQARAASITIVDGDQQNTTVPIDDESLKRGSLTYTRRTGNIVVRMRIAPERGAVVEEVARFIGPAPGATPLQQAKTDEHKAELEQMRAELERAKSELSRIQPESQRSRQLPLETVNPKPEVQRPRADVATLMKRPVTKAEIKLPDGVPQLQLKSTEAGAAPPIAVSVLPAAPPPVPAPVQARHAPKPASGRAIWTGRLPKGGLLLLEGARPSVGSMSGRFPQGRARIRVYPADLGHSGIQVYTAARPAVAVEPPSAANGWNLTTYAMDPKHSRAITVLEAPGQQNGWKPRLLIRGEDRAVTMLVIDWEEVGSGSTAP